MNPEPVEPRVSAPQGQKKPRHSPARSAPREPGKNGA